MITTTLEQSQKLKELGAPQETEHDWYSITLSDKTHYRCVPRLDEAIFSTLGGKTVKEYAAYTLEELIEWLGEDFYKLYHDLAEHPNRAWFAKNVDDLTTNGICASGKSALEAVYNLAVAVKGGLND